MKKTQTKNSTNNIVKIFTIAGLSVIAIACVANLFNVYTNMRFIHDPLFSLYYFRYIILLIGGLAIGYFLSKKAAGRRYDRLFSGVIFATLAMTIYWLTDLARLVLRWLHVDPSYPAGKIMFFGMPLAALALTLLIAYLVRRKQGTIATNALAKTVLIITFAASQAYYFGSSIYHLISSGVAYSPNMPIWLVPIEYLASPLVITAIAYLLLNKTKKQFDHLFYAILIGAFYSILSITLWEFRTNAEAASTAIFSTTVTTLALLLPGILLWHTRRALR